MGINVERKTNKKQIKYVSEGHTTEEAETGEKKNKGKKIKDIGPIKFEKSDLYR
jgi:hypothetical protein